MTDKIEISAHYKQIDAEAVKSLSDHKYVQYLAEQVNSGIRETSPTLVARASYQLEKEGYSEEVFLGLPFHPNATQLEPDFPSSHFKLVKDDLPEDEYQRLKERYIQILEYQRADYPEEIQDV